MSTGVAANSERMMKKERRLTRGIAACFLALVIFLSATLTTIRDQTRSYSNIIGLVSWKLNYSLALSSSLQVTRPKRSITCDCSHKSYDLCSINGPTALDPVASTLSLIDPTNSTPPNFIVKTHPYPRKLDAAAASRVKELILTSSPPKFPCGVAHKSPALVFSTGGYTGNFFHEFSDGFIPLYITINSFFPDQDVILVITNWKSWWARKYADLLPHFTRHPIINMDNQITTTHCFPSATVGLVKHGHMAVDPTSLPHPKTLLDFQQLLKKAYYNQGDDDHVLMSNKSTASARPQLVLANRKGNVGRVIWNLKEVIMAIKKVGFNVIVFEPKADTPLVNSFRLIHESHALVAVHGAAITHLLFQRPGAVLAGILGLNYMKYEIGVEESSLADKLYGTNDLVLKDPEAFVGKNWTKARVYLKTQNVKLDIVRFRGFLKKAFKKAKRFMAKEG
ncbi:unnamed protein product [Dovyalis caffra]|uniref:Glycosyltransferase 61 catalytic domain-containing protein n=1 Tax=Dovyalis caffra TaxID=77055 RepID=A0AAV1QWR1_9ROSI|nr:unnamed protein product [Dovyalis caffra]